MNVTAAAVAKVLEFKPKTVDISQIRQYNSCTVITFGERFEYAPIAIHVFNHWQT